MSLRQVVATYSGELSPSEQVVIKEIFTNPTEAAFRSATELAERSQVHAATVVRLARKLGYAGYPEMRAGLAAEVVSQQAHPLSERVQRSLEKSTQSGVLDSLIESEIGNLNTLRRHVSQVQLESAAKKLHKASRIYLFAAGHASVLLDLLDRRLRRAGYQTVDLRFTGRELAERVLGMQKDDALIGFALRRIPTGFVPLLKHTAKLGACSIVIADVVGPLIRPQPNVLLSAPRGDESSQQTLTVPMAIVNSLILTLAQQDGGRSLQALNQLESLLEEFKESL